MLTLVQCYFSASLAIILLQLFHLWLKKKKKIPFWDSDISIYPVIKETDIGLYFEM